MFGSKNMTLEEKAIETLRGVIDTHVGLSVWDMGLIHDMKVEGNEISLIFIPTSPFCPMGVELAKDIKKALKKLQEVDRVHITIQGHMNAKEINEMLAKD